MTAVVHLVWGPLGAARLREFLDSYRRHPAGAHHELVVLFNGVSREQESELLAELQGVEHTLLTLEEPVQDLLAYRQAAVRLEHDRVCFLNSYSVILAPDWLAKLEDAMKRPAAGIAGATGSWASLRSWALNGLFVPNPYRGVVPARGVAIEQFRLLQLELAQGGGQEPSPVGDGPRRSPINSARSAIEILRSTSEQLLRFEGFPAVHLRTNGFIIDRALFTELRTSTVGRKIDAYVLESGRHSFTRQIRDMGLHPLLVDREGAAYGAEEWAQSATFWQGDQERLMIADNQTSIYANGGLDRRRLLSALAWGAQADPRMPGVPSGNLVAGPEPGAGS